MKSTSGSTRRTFVQGAALGAGVAAVGATAVAAQIEGYSDPSGFRSEPLERVRIGFVGVGLQGGSHVRNFLNIDGVEIPAVCDVDAPRAEEVAGWVAEAGRPKPQVYSKGEEDWRRLLERDDIDLVFNATPWRWHVPVCVEAMKAGLHTAVEVPAAYRLDDCWLLVETAEATGRHCVMMENCNYGRAELQALRMVRSGALGEVIHAEGAYIHDLRAIKFSDANEGLWRLDHSKVRNGNLYPTHGLGPVANCMDINRGDAFDFVVSMSTVQRGISRYARERFGEDDSRSLQTYALGDMNTSLIRTKLGRTIMVQHDTTTPRPYSRIHLVQGTQGTFAGYPNRVFIEGRTDGHRWEDAEAYRDEFDHPLWRELEEKAAGAGHGGMDYLEDYRLIDCLRKGEPTDMDVYDAAALSALCECTEISVAEKSRPVEIPDFTRGRWAKRSPIGLGEMT
ncbi:MAG: Gfo/Idh/MocA family oxidoreductase [Acidobacteriota bacterium]